MTVIEELGGCCHGRLQVLRSPNGPWVVREKVKTGINTVTEVLSSPEKKFISFPARSG